MELYTLEKRRKFFEEAENILFMPPHIIEKDFWVCWTLELLFTSPFANVLTFKGGTSLSKGYKIINRFSEDIDLTIDKSKLALDPEKSLEEPDLSRNQRKKRDKTFHESVVAFIENEFQPWIENAIDEKLSGAGEQGYELISDPEDPLNLFFSYPKAFDYPDYIKPFVRLELGARGVMSPHYDMPVMPYVAEAMPKLFENLKPITVPILGIERTFWEKATILHSVACRPDDKPVRERFSRHYYDTFLLSNNTEVIEKAIQDVDLLEAVVANKKTYFFESWDWYDTAKKGSFRLIPADERIKDLREDYQSMQEMIFSDSPNFDDIISGLMALEDKINEK